MTEQRPEDADFEAQTKMTQKLLAEIGNLPLASQWEILSWLEVLSDVNVKQVISKLSPQ